MKNAPKRRTVRILHIGDLHLDSPFSRLRPEKSEERRRELRETFEKAIAYARDEAVDIILAAGDLFDSEYVTPATAKKLMDGFASCPHARVFISPGNHDPYKKGGAYDAARLPRNVHVFTEPKLSAVDIPEWNVWVYGWGFTSDRLEEPLLSGQHVEDPAALNLLCAHAEVGVPISKYAPVPLSDIAAFGADYAAFAHRHIPTEMLDAGGGAKYAYCGCIEGRSFDEPGRGGAYLIVATPNEEDDGYTLRAERLELAARRYEVAQLDLTGVFENTETAKRLKTLVKKNNYGSDTFLRVVFTGATPPDFSVPQSADGEMLGLYDLEIVDRTSPTFDAEALEKDLSVRGELYRYLLPRLTEGSPEERATAARALRIGLAALEGSDIATL